MRNCTWALLLDQETEQSVYVFSTHLHDPMGAAADEVRALQTQYLLEKAAQVMQAHPEASSLIMGDFNAQPDNDPASASKNCYNKDLETQINAASYQDTRVATEYGAKGSVHGSGCAQLRADGPGRDVRGLPCRTRRRDVRKAAMRRAGAIVPVAPVPVQDTALHIACGDERGFAQAVLTNDAAVLAALPPFEQAGALSNRLLADKTRLWFGDISGAQRCTETLGWRFAGAACGVLMLPGMYLLGRLLFKKRRYAILTCLCLAFDTLHFTQTRIATIDSFVVLFIIWSVYFMLRWFYTDFFGKKLAYTMIPLVLSGACMGLAVASKWTGCFAGLGLAAIFFFGIWRRWKAVREAKATDPVERDPLAAAAAKSGDKRLLITIASCLIFFVLVPAAIYYCSYIPYFAPSGGVTLKRIVDAAEYMLWYHSEPGRGMDHPYYAPWYRWPLSEIPMYYADDRYTRQAMPMPSGPLATTRCGG